MRSLHEPQICTLGETGGRKGGPVERFLVTLGLRCDSPAFTCILYGRYTGAACRADVSKHDCRQQTHVQLTRHS